MTYQDIHAARFLARPNRFIAQVELEGREETVHVKNTGRCRELLVPGCTVYLEGRAGPTPAHPAAPGDSLGEFPVRFLLGEAA